MIDTNEMKDQLAYEVYETETIPQGLNVLTILSYIGSAYQVAKAVYSYFMTAVQVKTDTPFTKSENKKLPPVFVHFFEEVKKMVQKEYDNRTLILIISIVAAAGCFYGALQMRKRKKEGFAVYAVSELIYPVAFMLITGYAVNSLFGVIMLMGFIFPILFIVLYTFQRKHLTL